jgi:hypothetical protein
LRAAGGEGTKPGSAPPTAADATPVAGRIGEADGSGGGIPIAVGVPAITVGAVGERVAAVAPPPVLGRRVVLSKPSAPAAGAASASEGRLRSSVRISSTTAAASGKRWSRSFASMRRSRVSMRGARSARKVEIGAGSWCRIWYTKVVSVSPPNGRWWPSSS